MDAFSSMVAGVMGAVAPVVSVGFIAEGKVSMPFSTTSRARDWERCSLTEIIPGIRLRGQRPEEPLGFMTFGLDGGCPKDARGVPKRHKANVGRHRMRTALRAAATGSNEL